MDNKKNKSIISSSHATSGAGFRFENQVQASFVVAMATGGRIALFPGEISKIQFQAKIDGYSTDDMIVFTKSSNQEEKLLVNIKSSIRFVKSNKELAEVIKAAWKDFNNAKKFNKNKDKIALITGLLNDTDTQAMEEILGAKCIDKVDFFTRIEKKNFYPPKSKEKLEVIRHHLNNVDKNISDEELYEFLNHWHLQIFGDLEKTNNSVILTSIFNSISAYSTQKPDLVWAWILNYVGNLNKNAGIITKEKAQQDFKDLFDKKPTIPIPDSLSTTTHSTSTYNFYGYEESFAIASLIGSIVALVALVNKKI